MLAGGLAGEILPVAAIMPNGRARAATDATSDMTPRLARGRNRGRAAGAVRRLALLYRPHPHALEAARRLPEERARIRRGLHHRARSALGRGTLRPRNRQPRRAALLDGPGAARSRAAVAAPLRRAPRHLRLRSPARPNPIAVSVARLVGIEGNTLWSSASTASTIRRSSTSSRILLRPIRCRMPRSAGMRGASAE